MVFQILLQEFENGLLDSALIPPVLTDISQLLEPGKMLELLHLLEGDTELIVFDGIGRWDRRIILILDLILISMVVNHPGDFLRLVKILEGAEQCDENLWTGGIQVDFS